MYNCMFDWLCETVRVFLCVRARLFARMRVCVCSQYLCMRVLAYKCVCLRVCMYVHVCMCACVRVSVCLNGMDVTD